MKNLSLLICLLISIIVISCQKEPDILTDQIKDYDNNIYHSIDIGTQTWMVENLKTIHLNNGTPIQQITVNLEWKNNHSQSAYCWYYNIVPNLNVNDNDYGALYNWYAVSTNKLCPAGWHVPSDGEWKTLEIYLGMSQQVADQQYGRGEGIGTLLKAVDSWDVFNGSSDNYHFRALSTGFRSGWYGDFGDFTQGAWWWSSTSFDEQTAWFRSITNETTIYRGNGIKSSGFSVRCVKN